MGGSIVEDRGRTGVRHAGSSCPTGGCGEPPRLPWPAAHSGAFVPAIARKWAGNGAEITPKVSSNTGQSLSQPAADSSLSTREPLRTEDADRRVASLLAMTVLILCHSEEAQRADVGLRPFLRWTGVWAAEVVGPYGRSTEAPATGRCGHRPLPTGGLPKSQQQADVGIGPYGKPNQPPKPAGAQRSVRARGREEWAGIDARTTPKGGPPPRLPRQRLAKRKARG